MLAFPAGLGDCAEGSPAAFARRRFPRRSNWRNFFRRMRSRLSRVSNWEGLAEEAGYNAKQLAQRCGVSRRQLERFFPRATGKTPQRWLNDLRQLKASELIASGQSVKEVSIRLGYKQASHFSREFKRFHGVPPSELPVGEFSRMSL